MIHTQQESANVARHVPKQHFASFAKNYLEWHFASYAKNELEIQMHFLQKTRRNDFAKQCSRKKNLQKVIGTNNMKKK